MATLRFPGNAVLVPTGWRPGQPLPVDIAFDEPVVDIDPQRWRTLYASMGTDHDRPVRVTTGAAEHALPARWVGLDRRGFLVASDGGTTLLTWAEVLSLDPNAPESDQWIRLHKGSDESLPIWPLLTIRPEDVRLVRNEVHLDRARFQSDLLRGAAMGLEPARDHLDRARSGYRTLVTGLTTIGLGGAGLVATGLSAIPLGLGGDLNTTAWVGSLATFGGVVITGATLVTVGAVIERSQKSRAYSLVLSPTAGPDGPGVMGETSIPLGGPRRRSAPR